MPRLAVVLLLLPFALTADTAQVRDRLSLEVGTVTVWLGMTQEEAAKKFRDAGYEATLAGNQLLLKSGSEAHVIWFKAGRLAFAEREWNTAYKVEQVDAVIGALGALAEKANNEPCSVIHSPVSTPNLSANRVFVSCGQRSVLIGNGTAVGHLSWI
jgi:hypothetical protein